MVIGGFTGQERCQLIDLSGQNLSCPYVHDYPEGYASVAAYVNRKAFVCGGISSGQFYTNACYSYNEGVSELKN